MAPALMILLGLAAQGTATPPSRAGLLATSQAEAAAPAARARTSEAYGKLPLRFEANRGQTDPRVKFLSRGNGYSLFLSPTEAVLSLRQGSSGMRLIPEKALFRSQIPNPKGPSINHPVGAPAVSLDSMTSDRGSCTNYFTVKMPKSIEGPFLSPGAANFAWPCRFKTDPKPSMGTVLRMHFLGANPAPQVEGLEPLPGRSHYFIGNDPEKWRPNLPAYARVQYKALYPGVDLVFYGNQRQLEYDMVVAPGANPKAIRLAFKGADKLSLDDQGNLILKTAGGELRQYPPRVYQEVDGSRRKIDGHYVLQGKEKDQVGFEVTAYDPARPLVIDPTLAYSTYLGGSSSGDGGQDIAVDAEGNAYVTGMTSSTDFPSALGELGGGGDAFVAKLNPAGSALLYATYLGGSEDLDFGNGIAVDGSGNAYVTGMTQSDNFPTTPGAFQRAFGGGFSDAFVAKFDPDGTLVYATYLGGRENDPGLGIAVDSFGNAYVTGGTFKDPDFPADFPTQNPLQAFGGGFEDAFVAKLNPEGSALVYSTFLGGSSSEFGTGIAVDTSGNAYVTGVTFSADFPTKNPLQSVFGGNQDAFVAKINAEGSALVYSTYLGGRDIDVGGGDLGGGIAVDTAGSAYVTGATFSPDFPTSGAIDSTCGTDGSCNPDPSGNPRGDAFVAKLSPAGSALVYSTFLGGSGGDHGEDIAVDSAGNAYVTGFTSSTDFPTANPLPLQSAHHGGFLDAFVTKINPTGSALIYSTYLGGSGPVEGFGRDDGHGIAVDGSGNAYVTGDTSSTDFPLQNPLQSNLGDGRDAFIAKIEDVGPTEPVLSVDPTSLDFGNVSVGSSDDQGILVKNIGGGTLTGNASTNAPFSVLSGGSYSLGAGLSQTVTVRFSPASVGPFTGNVAFTGGEGATVTVTGRGVAHDLAVTKITAPKVVTLTAKKPEQTRVVKVQIQNRSPHSEIIQDPVMLENLVSLEVESLGSDPPCPEPIPELHVGGPQKTLPVTLKPKKTLDVIFDVTFTLECANDPAISTRKAMHEDYRYIATVDHAELDGEDDSDPADDICPRDVIPPFRLDQYPDRTIKDTGCGAPKPDKTLGNPVLTDLVVK